MPTHIFTKIYNQRPCIEPLEQRRLLSANPVAAFSAHVPLVPAVATVHHLNTSKPFVDLVSAFVTLPAYSIRTNGIVANQPQVALRIVNIGTKIAHGTIDLRLYMARGTVLNKSATLVNQWISAKVAINPGHSRLFSTRIQLPSGTLSGRYTLFAVAKPVHGILVRHPADLIAAGARPLHVASRVAISTLLANYRRHHRHCTFYAGTDYCADTSAAFGLDVAVTEGDSIPPGFSPDFPTTAPSSQPSSQPSDDSWNSGLQQAIDDVSADEASNDGGTDVGGIDDSGSDNWDDSGSSDSSDTDSPSDDFDAGDY